MNSISVGTRGIDQQLLRNYQRSNERIQTSLERLSTGKRINRPKDDPAGFIAAEGFRRDLTDLKAKLHDISSERLNVNQQESGLAAIQTALSDLRSRLAEVPDNFVSAEERAAIKTELDQAADAIDRIAQYTGVGGAGWLRDGNGRTISAESAAEQIDVESTGATANRASLAAYEHTQLDTFEQLYQDQIAITTEALSQVEDTDFAAETANLVQSQILSQGAMAALSYANRQHAEQVATLLNEVA